MKTINFFISMILFSALIFYISSAQTPSCSPTSPCCCKTLDTEQRRCYSQGVCCAVGTSDEYWSADSCYTFTLTVSAPPSFVISQKTDIVVTIRNDGSYSDTYNLGYTLFFSNPSVISLETASATSLSVNPNQVKSVLPKITVFSSTANGILMVTATSTSDPTRWRAVNVSIVEGSLPLSLPEFDLSALLFLFGIAGVIYYNSIKPKMKNT